LILSRDRGLHERPQVLPTGLRACLIALYGIIEAIYVVHMLGLGSVLSVVKPPGELKNGFADNSVGY